jgi:hypothetical protein
VFNYFDFQDLFFLKFVRKSNYWKEIKVSVVRRYEEQYGWTELTKKNKKIKCKHFVVLISKKNLVPMERYKMLAIPVDASITVTWAKQRQTF